MFQQLSQPINSEWKILKLQDGTSGILRRLQKFIGAVKESKETKAIYSRINMEIVADNSKVLEAIEKSMEWVKEIFVSIEAKSRSSNIKKEIEYFFKVFSGQEIMLSGPNSIQRSLTCLEDVISKLATTNKSLVEKFSDDNGQPYFQIENGHSVHFMYPSFVEIARKNITYTARNDSKESLKNDEFTLLKHLQTLSLYGSYKPLLLSKEINPKNWQENDALLNQAELGYYLSSFSVRNKKKDPDTREEILQQIKMFLILLEAEINHSHSIKENLSPNKISTANPDEISVKNFIITLRRDNPQLSRDSVVSKIQVAIAKKELLLSKSYADSTYKKWDRNTDPIKDMSKKLKRPKSKNR